MTIPGVTEEKAVAIAKLYPTLYQLMMAYQVIDFNVEFPPK